MNEQANSSHPLPNDETVRTRDETPIRQVHACFWHGLLHWYRATRCARVPSTRPLEFFKVVDNPQEVVDPIFKYYERCGFGLSAEEQEILLHL